MRQRRDGSVRKCNPLTRNFVLCWGYFADVFASGGGGGDDDDASTGGCEIISLPVCTFRSAQFFFSCRRLRCAPLSSLLYLLLTLSGLLDNNNNKKLLLFELVTIA